MGAWSASQKMGELRVPASGDVSGATQSTGRRRSSIASADVSIAQRARSVASSPVGFAPPA